MAGSRSREKGARGERAVAKMLERIGVHGAHRTQQDQSGGTYKPGDITCDDPFFETYHLEIKNDENVSVWSAMKQAHEDCPPKKIPLVFMHRNRHTWIVVMDAEDWLELKLRSML